jgi:hypothetical protein
MIRRFVSLFSLLALGGALTFAEDGTKSKADGSSKWPRVRLGGIVVGAGYSHFSGGRFYGYPGYGYPGWGYTSAIYDPFFYGIPLYAGNFYGYGPQAGRGEVKLHSVSKDASVFLDGAFAGEAGKLRTMWLDPGVYDLEVKPRIGTAYQKRIYVLSGKSLRIDADSLTERKQ